jgi:hypothetical protein
MWIWSFLFRFWLIHSDSQLVKVVASRLCQTKQKRIGQTIFTKFILHCWPNVFFCVLCEKCPTNLVFSHS